MELLAIIRRIDTNGDAMLSFEEFEDFLKPELPVVTHQFEPIPPPVPVLHYNARGSSPLRDKSPRRLSSPI